MMINQTTNLYYKDLVCPQSDLYLKKLFEWKELDGKDARVVDYFDVSAGTSTGGILATMITAPNEKNLSFCAAKDIVSFYFEQWPKDFPTSYIIVFTYYLLILF
ncbi:hypothetical protein H5410_039515 [Solanum commersonii]|uniref:PNPLA domain-containing protein n=1 Tax=Solanum commersonii TaxID=4109 RepID=A0A9J5XL61_SOLCO|nr:hypothetical protein H5410_039515 [Solanum commersonii]